MATVNVYLGEHNGGFSIPATYSPYPVSFDWEDLNVGFDNILGDFDGDGNTDLAFIQLSPLDGGSTSVQFLKGNGDGTFTPTFDLFPFGIATAPELSAYNLLGDGRSSLVQTPSFNASYQIIPGIPAPAFQIAMAAVPVLDNSDALIVSLNVASSSDTTVTLSASDPNVDIPVSATVPAGQVSVQVPFTLATTYPADHWFSITAQQGTTTAIAYNYPLSAGLQSPFVVSVTGGFVTGVSYAAGTPAPGQTSTWEASLASVGLGYGTFQLSCTGLPATASCSTFSPPGYTVEPSEANNSKFTITTDPTIAPGQYPFSVVATSAYGTISGSSILRVGDFSLAIAPPTSVSAAPSGTASFTVNATGQFGYEQPISLTCSGLPAGASCSPISLSYYPSVLFGPLVVNLSSAAAGTYTFTITGASAGTLTHSVTAQLQIVSEPLASLNQSPLSFGSHLINSTTSASPITLANTGNVPLNITGIVLAGSPSASGGFAQTNTCGSSLAPASSCTITATFDPTAVGNSVGTLTVTDNASASPQVIPLSGTAVDFSITAAPGGSPSATVPAGQSTTYNLQIQGDQFTGMVNLACSGAPANASCSVPPDTSVTGNTPAPFQAKIVTSASSSSLPITLRFRTRGSRQLISAAALALALVASMFLMATRYRELRTVLWLVVFMAAATLIAGCAGANVSGNGKSSSGNPTPATAPGTYTLTVTGTYNGGTRTLNLTLTVN